MDRDFIPDDAVDDERTPDAGLVEFGSRLVWAATAMVSTILVGQHVLHLHGEGVSEVALLNGGVAYYTHEAAGSVVKSLNRLYRAAIRRRNESEGE